MRELARAEPARVELPKPVLKPKEISLAPAVSAEPKILPAPHKNIVFEPIEIEIAPVTQQPEPKISATTATDLELLDKSITKRKKQRASAKTK